MNAKDFNLDRVQDAVNEAAQAARTAAKLAYSNTVIVTHVALLGWTSTRFAVTPNWVGPCRQQASVRVTQAVSNCGTPAKPTCSQ